MTSITTVIVTHCRNPEPLLSLLDFIDNNLIAGLIADRHGDG